MVGTVLELDKIKGKSILVVSKEDIRLSSEPEVMEFEVCGVSGSGKWIKVRNVSFKEGRWMSVAKFDELYLIVEIL